MASGAMAIAFAERQARVTGAQQTHISNCFLMYKSILRSDYPNHSGAPALLRPETSD